MDIAEEIKEVYAVYCRNHDDAISLMEKVHGSLQILFWGIERVWYWPNLYWEQGGREGDPKTS